VAFVVKIKAKPPIPPRRALRKYNTKFAKINVVAAHGQ
jgi:hypothetical protein